MLRAASFPDGRASLLAETEMSAHGEQGKCHHAPSPRQGGQKLAQQLLTGLCLAQARF